MKTINRGFSASVIAYAQLFLAGILLVVMGAVVQAQPAPQHQWVRYVGQSRAYEYAGSTLRLSASRYASAGQQDPNNGSSQAAYLAFTNAAGVALSEHLFPVANHSSTGFTQLAAAERGNFYGIGFGIRTPSGLVDNYLLKFDSLGNLLWRRSYRLDSTSRQDFSLIAAPRGGYTSAYKIYSSSDWHAEVTRFDERGRMQWARRLGNYSSAYRMAPLPDGAYVVAATDPGRVPAPVYYYTDFNIKLYKISPTGDSISSVWVPASGYHDKTIGLTPTRDGGLLVVGYSEPSVNSTQPRALCIKLDSLWQEEWRYTVNPGRFHQAQELANGHFVLSGTTLPPFYLTELIPPALTTPADTLPTVAWALYRLPVLGQTMFFESNGGIRLIGGAVGPTPRGADLGIEYLTGLTSAPVSVNMCARPPVLAQPPTFSLPVGNTINFALDSVATLAGPRYGEVSLVTWDFGDGTPADTGWTVSHAFATPTPVRVRVCATNNLFCQTCATLEPLGPVGLAEELAASISVFPNPSASGQFTVHTGGGPETRATFTVFDGVGRTVAAGVVAGAETALDLRAQAAGVYALRLTWPDGRAVSKRLVRW